MAIINLSKSLSMYEDGIELISRKLGHQYVVSENIDEKAINILSLKEAKANKDFADFINDVKDERWHAIFKLPESGFIVCGDRKIDYMHALLKVLDRADEDIKEYNVSKFKRLYENFDDFYGGFARAADDFDLEIHMIDTVRAGVESFEVNTLYDDIPIQVRERGHKDDVYFWWCTYCPGLDMFYESKLFRGVHKETMLEKNRNNLKNNARLANALGLAPVFTTFEPRCIPERFFMKYPELRGARVDYDAYSAAPEYGLDPTHPLVLEHFSEMMAMLMEDVPELALFEIWSQDSNASFPWADRTYMKSNGPLRLFNKDFHEIVNPLLVTLSNTAKKYNKDTRVNLNLDWVFSDREKRDVMNNLPENVGVTFNFTSYASGADDFGIGDASDYKAKIEERLEDAQFITHGVAHDWKTFAPLVGFPYPKATYNHLLKVVESKVPNFTLRGGLCTRAYVPDYINNEIIREIKNVCEKAKKYSMYVLFTCLEEDKNGMQYNTAYVITPDGKIFDKYRKTHLTLSELKTGLVPGDAIKVFDLPIGKFGILICWDQWFTQAAKEIEKQGAEMFFWLTRGYHEERQVTRARDTGMYVITSHPVPGNCRIAHPTTGKFIARGEGTSNYAMAKIDLDERQISEYKSFGVNGGNDKDIFINELRNDLYTY